MSLLRPYTCTHQRVIFAVNENILQAKRFCYAGLLLIPLSVSASAYGQDAPRVEVFGGYSYLRLTEQTRSLLQPANLNGWDASVKLNLTPRIGLVADFSGYYGQRGLMPYSIFNVSQPSASQAVSAQDGKLRQHSFLFGPEVRVFERNRWSVNARALIGVAHTGSLVLPLRNPILTGDASGLITERTFLGSNTFAASLGGNIDYRISNHVSYRILQPELFLTRSGTAAASNWNQYNLRVSSGIVFTSGSSSSTRSTPQRFSFGVIGGVALTDAFDHESTGFAINPNGGLDRIRSRAYSTAKDYAVGPMLEFGLPWQGFAVEIDALYRPLHLTTATVSSDGTLNSVSPATVVTWQFPVLAKYRIRERAWGPFIEAGPSFRVAGNLNDAAPSAYGGTAGLGMDAQLAKLRVSPVLRYTHWAADPNYATSRTKRNQLELLVGLSF